METRLIAVCDDMPEARDALAAAIRNCPPLRDAGAKLHVFPGAKEFLDAIGNGHRYDFIFMDMLMPETSGVDAISALPPDCDAPVMFVTAYTENWPKMSGFIEAGFLVKPYTQETFNESVQAVLGRRISVHRFEYTADYKRGTVICNRVRYFSAQNHSISMHTIDGTIPLMNARLKDIAGELAPHGFFLCNRSYLINLRFYNDRTKMDVLLNSRNGIEKIPLSRRKSAEIEETYIVYKTRGEHAF
jgi:DNA-binding LytR/AlgR family response regulator